MFYAEKQNWEEGRGEKEEWETRQAWCAFSSFADAEWVQQYTNSDFPSPFYITPLISVYGDLYFPQLWRSLQIQRNTSSLFCPATFLNK